MAMLNGGILLAQALKKEGVECVFALAGGHIMPILYACRDAGIKVVDGRHESAVGHAADAYAKVTGKPGVFFTTAGPGVTNACTAMAEAMVSGTPVIHIGGASPRGENDTAPLQNVKSFEAMDVFSKWSRKVHDVERIPEYIAMAFRNCLSGEPGPVYLEIPIDIVHKKAEDTKVYWPENYRTEAQPWGDPELVEKAADMLINAKRPAMAIGDIARYSAKYAKEVEELANYLSMPTHAFYTARGTFADETKNPLFLLGMGALGQADVILELATFRDSRMTKGKPPTFAKCPRIVVYPDKSMIGFNGPADVGIVAGTSEAAKQILEAVKRKLSQPKQNPEWLAAAQGYTYEVAKEYIESAASELQPPHPGRVAAECAKFLNEEAPDWHIVCDGGDASIWSNSAVTARYPGQVVTFGPLGTIGTGPAFTLGAHMADGKPVLYYSGDGSFGFYMGEWDTFVRHNVPVVAVISNDSAWGMIKMGQVIKNKDYLEKNGTVALDLAHMRAYHELPKMWGGVGVEVTRYEDIIPAIRKVAESGLPGIVNVQVDKTIPTPYTALSFAKLSQLNIMNTEA